MRNSLTALIAVLGGGVALAAQTPKSFDAASVKPVVIRPGVGFSCGFRWEAEEGVRALAGSFRTLMPVKCLIALAHDVPVAQVVGSPGWVDMGADMHLFEIEGRSSEPATQGDTKAMLRTLLAERFGLVVRTEPDFKATVWVLTMARKDGQLGRGIRPAEGECIKTPQNVPVSQRRMRPGLPVPCGMAADGHVRAGGGQPFSSVIFYIRLGINDELIDHTGLTGLFDFYANIPGSLPSGQPDPDAVSIFTAVQEELGLKLAQEEVTRPAVIIERVSRPTPN